MDFDFWTWKNSMELSRTICGSIIDSEDVELMEITISQLVKIRKIIEDETQAYIENLKNNK